MEDIVKTIKEIHQEEADRLRRNPLAAYSTAQLKAELQRRKRWMKARKVCKRWKS